jgi:hypothetical protein
MKDRKHETRTRRPYQKPRLEKVKLVTEEAVLTTCKRGIPLGSGLGGDCMWIIRCDQVGS